MKRFSQIGLLFMMLVLILSACQQAPAAPVAEAVEQESVTEVEALPAEDTVLTVTGPNGDQLYTMADLLDLPQITGQAGIKSSTGKITPPSLFKGVLLTDLLEKAGGADPSMSVEVEAEDGYAITFSYDQVAKGTYITYDPGTGDEMNDAGELKTILAYEMDGKPLNEQMDGKLRLVVVSEKNNQVVDGHWSVKFINQLTVKSLAEDWTVYLKGEIEETIDRGSFESCSTGKCHQASWQDDKAQTWVGVPLYLMVGRVDDENKHSDDAFNLALAEDGYTVDVISKDGYTVTLYSTRLIDNPNIQVAFVVNDTPLSDKDFPLKLVGSDLAKNEMVGMIDRIILNIGTEPTTEEVAEPVAETTEEVAVEEGNKLVVEGKIETPAEFTKADLVELGAGKVTVEHPKKGPQEAEGISIKTLLDKVKASADAKTLVIKASDGYSMEVEISKVMDCDTCIIAFDTKDTFKSMMPGMDTAYWVKDVVSLIIK